MPASFASLASFINSLSLYDVAARANSNSGKISRVILNPKRLQCVPNIILPHFNTLQ